MTDTPFLAPLLIRFFSALESSGVLYLVLRNYEELPEATTNDVDLLVDPDQLIAAVRCLEESALTTGWRIHNIGEFSCWTFFLHHLDSFAQVHIDFMCGIKWYSALFADHKGMFNARRRFKCFYIPSQEHETAINMTTRLLYCGCVRQKYRKNIAEAAGHAPERLVNALSPWVGHCLAAEFVIAAQSEDWDRIERFKNAARIRVLIANMRTPLSFLFRILSDFGRLMRRLYDSPGLSLAIFGLDETETARVSADVVQAFSGTFSPERTRRLRWDTDRSEQFERRDAVGECKGSLRVFLTSLLFVACQVGACFSKWIRQVKPTLFRNGFVVFESYYNDLLLPRTRIRRNFVRVISRLGVRVMPKPNLVVVLDHPRRENENEGHFGALSNSEFVRVWNMKVVDASSSAEATLMAVRTVVFSFLVSRSASRMSRFR